MLPGPFKHRKHVTSSLARLVFTNATSGKRKIVEQRHWRLTRSNRPHIKPAIFNRFNDFYRRIYPV